MAAGAGVAATGLAGRTGRTAGGDCCSRRATICGGAVDGGAACKSPTAAAGKASAVDEPGVSTGEAPGSGAGRRPLASAWISAGGSDPGNAVKVDCGAASTSTIPTKFASAGAASARKSGAAAADGAGARATASSARGGRRGRLIPAISLLRAATRSQSAATCCSCMAWSPRCSCCCCCCCCCCWRVPDRLCGGRLARSESKAAVLAEYPKGRLGDTCHDAPAESSRRSERRSGGYHSADGAGRTGGTVSATALHEGGASSGTGDTSIGDAEKLAPLPSPLLLAP